MKRLQKKICPICGKEFVPKNSAAQMYCDSYKGGPKTCKTYSSRIRTGKMEALAVEPVKDTPVSPTILMSDIEEKIKPIKGELNSLQLEIQKITKEYIHLESNMYGDGELENSDALRHNEKGVKYYKEILLQEGLSNSEIERYKKELQNCTNIVKNLNDQYQANFKKRQEMRLIFIDKNVRLFRLIEGVNNYAYSLLINDKILTANRNKLLMKFKTYYPFDKVILEGHYKFFACLGTLPQPFFGCFTGKPSSGTTRISIKVCSDLVNFFNFKILYIGSVEQINNEFNELVAQEVDSDLFAYKNCTSKLEITKLIQNGNYELLIIDPIDFFYIDYNFIYNLQKQHPKLSVIGILKGNMKSLERNANVIINVKNGEGIPIKGGNSDYSVSAWKDASYHYDENEDG